MAWEQLEFDFTPPRVWTLEEVQREYPALPPKGHETMLAVLNKDRTMEKANLEQYLTNLNDDNAYITDTKVGYKILNRDCERCNREADTDLIPHYGCSHGAHCTRNSCF